MKKTMFLIICLGMALLVSGCGAVSSGVVKVGLDTYTVNVSSSSSPSDAKKIAYSDAVKKCTDYGREMKIVQEKQSTDIRLYMVDLLFKCVSKDELEGQK